MSTSKAVVFSQVSTIILSFLTPYEQVQKAQLTCSKWYNKFLPQVMGSFKLNFTFLLGRPFRLVFEEHNNGLLGGEGEAAPLYLALVTGN